MPDYSAAADSMRTKFDDAWSHQRTQMKEEVFASLDDHLAEVEGYNRGYTSTAYTGAQAGPPIEPMNLRIQNTATRRTMFHECGHALMDALGVDCTQEATDRASNKSNYSRWPQFSFGKKDSPVERFLFRRYGDLPNIGRMELTDANIGSTVDRSDVFYIPDKDTQWHEAHTYRFTTDQRENRRYHDPVIWDGDEPVGIELCELDSRTRSTTAKAYRDREAYIVDRYELTPGLADILDVDREPEWKGVNRVLYQLNTHWYDAVTLVRKRGDKRERGQLKAPQGQTSSYYLMNAHEFFAETWAQLMRSRQGEKRAKDNIERMRDTNPGLIEAIEEEMLA